MAINQPKSAPQMIQQTAQNVQDIKRGVQDSVSAVKNFKTGNWASAAKDAVKVLKNKNFLKHVLIFMALKVAVPILLMLLLAGFYYVIIGKIGEVAKKLVSSTGSSVSKSVRDAEFEDGKLIITIDKEKFKVLKETLKSSGVDSEAAGMTDECVKIFMLSEYATLYPVDVVLRIEITEDEEKIIKAIGLEKIITSKGDNKYIHTQGCITIKRPEFTTEELHITLLEEMEKYEKGEAGYTFDMVKNYYAIDKTGCLVIPEKEIVKEIEGKDEVTDKLVQWDDEEKYDWETFNKNNLKSETTTPKLQKIPYKSEMSIYGMPYEFITLLTTFTKCPEYGLEVAKLVIDKTKITINILDDSKTTEDRTTKRYRRETNIKYAAGAVSKTLRGATVYFEPTVKEGIKDITRTKLNERTVQFFNNYLDNRYDNDDEYIFLEEQMLWDETRETSYEAYHVQRFNTITTQYTSKLQVEEVETWFFKKKTKYDTPKPTPLEKDDTVENNPNVLDITGRIGTNFIGSFPYKKYGSLSNLNEKDEAFKKFIKEIFNPEHGVDGTSIDKFQEFLNSKYDKTWFIEFLDKYVDEDIRKQLSWVLPAYADKPDKTAEMKQAMENALTSYKGRDADFKIDKYTYQILPSEIDSEIKDARQREVVYKSETIYNVINVGEAEDNTDDFIKLLVTEFGDLRQYVYYDSLYGSKTAPCEDLISGAEMFFQLLADNDKTANLENAMRYIMYKITGIDYGVTKFKKAFFSLKNFDTADILYDFIRIWENDDLYRYYAGLSSTSEFVKNGHYLTEMCPDDYNNPVYLITYGVVLIFQDGSTADENIQVLNGFDKSITNDLILKKYNKAGVEFTELTPSLLEKAFEEIVENWRKSVRNEVKDLDLNEDQINALTIISYQCGNINGFREAYHLYKEGKIEEFKSTFKGGKAFKTGLERSGSAYSTERAEATWRVFSEGYYAWESEGLILDKRDYKKTKKRSGKLGELVDYALSLKGKELRDIDPNAPGNVEGKWCAWYVSHCFDHVGLIPDVLEYASYECTGWWQDFLAKGKAKKKGEYIPSPGDIFFKVGDGEGKSSHVGIVYDCDGTNVYTIEGNTWGGDSTSICWDHVRTLDSADILGYYMASQF